MFFFSIRGHSPAYQYYVHSLWARLNASFPLSNRHRRIGEFCSGEIMSSNHLRIHGLTPSISTEGGRENGVLEQLAVTQNKCFWVAGVAYRATPFELLHVDTNHHDSDARTSWSAVRWVEKVAAKLRKCEQLAWQIHQKTANIGRHFYQDGTVNRIIYQSMKHFWKRRVLPFIWIWTCEKSTSLLPSYISSKKSKKYTPL